MDDSPYAIGASAEVIEAMAESALLGGGEVNVHSAGQQASNWKHWEKYCRTYAVITPWRPDLATLDAAGVERERIIWTAFLPWVMTNSMKPAPGRFLPNGQPCPPKPESGMAVLRGIRALHTDRGIETPSLRLASRRCHEMMLRYRDEYGPHALQERRKESMNHKIICQMCALSDEELTVVAAGAGRARKAWSWSSALGVSWRALVHTLAQTGMRKAEVVLPTGERWGKKHISFANLTWNIAGVHVPAPTIAQLRGLMPGDYAVLTPPPSKADPFGMRWGNHPIWLPFCPRAAINAARSLAAWEITAAVPAERRESTPLFCGVEGAGAPLTESLAESIFERMITLVVGPAEASKYSLHSFRSYLASAMMAAGCTDLEIQAACRWATNEAMARYRRAEPAEYAEWLTKAEAVRLTARVAVNLPRAMPRLDHDDMAAAFYASRAALAREADASDAAADRERARRGRA